MKQKTFIVDTNVLVRYFYTDDLHQTELVAPYFENAQYHLVIASETLCELAWVLHKKMKIKSSVIAMIIQTLARSENITITNLPAVNMGLKFLEHNRDFADGVIAYQVSQFDNATWLTFDKQASKIANYLNISVQQP